MALKQYLEKHYTSLRGHIDGGNYPPPAPVQMMAMAASYMQVGGIGLMFLGGPLFQAMGIAQPPEWYVAMRENQLQVFLGLFLVSSVAQNMAATGAFEITLNGKKIFSKLEKGRMPSIQEIDALLQSEGIIRTFGEPEFEDRQI